MTNKVHQIITDRIIEAIEANGTLPWQKGWSGVDDAPVNHAGKAYRGINLFVLAFAKASGGYTSNFWLTPNQVRKMGGTIIKGEHVQYITFWKVGEAKDVTGEDGVTRKKRSFLLRYYKVVNLNQTEGVKLTKKMKAESEPKPKGKPINVIDEAEAILATYLTQDEAPSFAEDGGNRAYYLPTKDAIHIPTRQAHHSDEEFYSTAFHEVGHSTGHSTRCKREGIVQFDHFGSGQYAKEELVAEMTSVMLCSQAGIVDRTIDNSAAYLNNWTKAIKDDPTMLIGAAGQAQKAADFVLGTKFDKGDDE